MLETTSHTPSKHRKARQAPPLRASITSSRARLQGGQVQGPHQRPPATRRAPSQGQGGRTLPLDALMRPTALRTRSSWKLFSVTRNCTSPSSSGSLHLSAGMSCEDHDTSATPNPTARLDTPPTRRHPPHVACATTTTTTTTLAAGWDREAAGIENRGREWRGAQQAAGAVAAAAHLWLHHVWLREEGVRLFPGPSVGHGVLGRVQLR